MCKIILTDFAKNILKGRPAPYCCWCIKPETAVILFPIFDLVEACVSILSLVLIFTLQDSYFPHASYIFAVLLLTASIRLCGTPLIFGAQAKATTKIQLYRYRLYTLARLSTLCLFAALSLTGYLYFALKMRSEFNNPQFGFCNYCIRRVAQCEQDFEAYLQDFYFQAFKQAKQIEPGSVPSYEQYQHRMFTKTQCQQLHLMVFMAYSSFEVVKEVIFVLASWRAAIDCADSLDRDQQATNA